MSQSQMQEEIENDMDVDVDLKIIFSGLGMKIFRFVMLAHVYHCYEVVTDVHDIPMHGLFPKLYMYLWNLTSFCLGLLLFLFGRSTLISESISTLIESRNFLQLKYLCNGTIYEYFNIWLNWLYPFIVMTTWCFYTRLKVTHTAFVTTYYAGLALIYYYKLYKIRFISLFLITLSHMYIVILGENRWGTVGATFMMYNNFLLANDLISRSKIVPENSRFSRPWALVIGAVGATYAISQSFHSMNNFVNKEKMMPSFLEPIIQVAKYFNVDLELESTMDDNDGEPYDDD